MTSECAGAVLEAAEKKRQSLGLKTVGCGPMVESRNKDAEMKLARTREASADAVQAVAREADELDCMESDHEFEMITSSRFMIDFRLTQETVTGQIKRRRKERPQKKTSSKRDHANKMQKNLFSKKVEGVHMDLLTCESSLRQFTFKVLDTMGYIKEVTLKKSSSTCSSSWCSCACHHLMWIFHNVFKFGGDDQILYQMLFNENQWQKIWMLSRKKCLRLGCATQPHRNKHIQSISE